MQITLEIPDELADTIGASREDLSRAALEALGLEAYRQRRISAYQLRNMLGIPSRFDLDAFLKEHKVETYTMEDFEQDWATIMADRKAKHPA